MTWTDERISDLTRLWDSGHSASHIGKVLGVSKNAVIGKAHRLNLQRGAPIPEPQPEPAPPVREEPPPILSPDVRPWMCRWQTDDAGRHGLNICGKTVQPGRHYCAEHLTASYLQRKRTAA